MAAQAGLAVAVAAEAVFASVTASVWPPPKLSPPTRPQKMAASAAFFRPLRSLSSLSFSSSPTVASIRIPLHPQLVLCPCPHPHSHLSRLLRIPRSSIAQDVAPTEPKQDEEETLEGKAKMSNGKASKESTLTVQALLENYKVALADEEVKQIAEIDARLLLLENERDSLLRQVFTLTGEVSSYKERFLRLNADFDNFRKRSERDRVAMSSTAKADVIKSLLPIIGNFDRAKVQLKIQTEAEQGIDKSYQGIYKQFVEALRGMGVFAVETIGKKFDPNVHEAIMREESLEYEEGIVVEEFRKGFLHEERLLRAAMVKVSAGSGKTKPIS